uniref:NADH-ubiquinone oxidoreductase chain 5 n=1 Tax=Bryozoa sp. TaxID=2813608 RepID=A0AAU8L189_9BILA
MVMNLKIFQLSIINCYFSIMMDMYSILFSLSVILITSCVMLYSSSYMSGEINNSKFYKLVFGFMMSMLILICSSNMFLMMMGWDGLGILSFILVIFYQNEVSLGSGFITLFTNRAGDAFLLVLISFMGLNMNWGFMTSFSLLMMMILITGAITKSAQLPFCSWLPRAMAAPTPVSSLVHSSTLVTAGVFLLIRFSENLNYSIILILGSFTTLLAGLSGMVEHDLKKIIALSTLSQLGVMFMSLGLNVPNVAFFHLCTHAFFKAMIFICAGDMISTMQGSQDIRLYGNSFIVSPLVCMFLTSGLLALSGLPFLAGFYSKDAMLDNFMMSNVNFMLTIMSWVGIIMTALYSVRFIIYNIWNINSNISFYFNKNMLTIYPLFILNLGAICFGSILSYYLYFNPIFMSQLLKLFPLFMMILGVSISFNLWFLEFKEIILSSIGFLDMLTKSSTNTQIFMKKSSMMSELGWMEMIPKSIKFIIEDFKFFNLFLSMIAMLALSFS